MGWPKRGGQMEFKQETGNARTMSELRITLDGGTTNTRAMLVRQTDVIDSVAAQVGVRDSRAEGPSPVLASVAECLNTLKERHHLDPAKVPVIASGMIGSDAGLVNVPHLMAPASASDAARHLHPFFNESIWPEKIYIIPGVRTGPNQACVSPIQQSLAQDVMRGEETQVWGLSKLLQASRPEQEGKPWLLLWPGSHTKLISIGADGRILGSFTTLAGELFASLKSATLLRRSLPDQLPEEYPEKIVAEAIQTVREQGFLRAAFWTRVADLTGTFSAEERAVWLSAAVIAEDARTIGQHAWLCGDKTTTLLIGGDGLRRRLYHQMISPLIQHQTVTLSADECEKAAAVGAVYVHSLMGRDDNESR